ncbi:hypothetical protein J4464_04915 [Candidatus Woesearchaeota archaeon]|nr:hypothetical protein [Candidatus Woesearchaeota archaeon]
MIYLAIFWIGILALSLTWFVAKFLPMKRVRDHLDREGFFYYMVLGCFLIMAILTNDPVSFLGIEIPWQMQWLVSLLAMFGIAWQFYLKPLKENVHRIDKDVVEVRMNVGGLEKGVNKIEQRFGNMEFRVNRLEGTVERLGATVEHQGSTLDRIDRNVAVLMKSARTFINQQ